MGTRGFVGFVHEGDVHISYQQYDSYPDGVGANTVNWLCSPEFGVVSELRKRAGEMQFRAQDQETEATPQDLATYAHLAENPNQMEHLDNYWLFHSLQGDLGAMFREGVFPETSPDWPKDGLFCEWGYLLDLDGQTLEVYRGFQTEPHTSGRWGGTDKSVFHKPRYEGDKFYHPVKLVAIFQLADLTLERFTETMAEIEQKIEEAYEAEFDKTE